MTREESCSKIDEAIAAFPVPGQLTDLSPYGNGHINDTFLLTYSCGGTKQLILQRMNRNIFHFPERLMENINGVTAHLRKEISKAGGDPERETLHFQTSSSGKNYYVDSNRNYWRMCGFIESSICLESITAPEDFYQSAVGFGRFQKLLSDYPAHTLYETIPHFHDTVRRFEALKKAVATDSCDRAKTAADEIRFAMEREADAGVLVHLQGIGQLPLRVTHNDTKLNNVLLDKATRKALCIIDLDTVMPGLSANDFGDSIRFGASTGSEDEKDLSKISLDLHLFDLYAKGFLEACGENLTEKEIEVLPLGAKLMTFECGIRFLTDYLQGDAYFKISRSSQNLDRCRTQFKLVRDMEQKMDCMYSVIQNHKKILAI